MAEQTVEIIRDRYDYVDNRRKQWDWLGRTDAPRIDGDLVPNGTATPRVLVQVRLWRDTVAGERILSVHLAEHSTAQILTNGNDLSSEFDTNGSATLRLGNQRQLTGLQRLSGRTGDPYLYTPGSGFSATQFDALWNSLGIIDENERATLIIRDFDPTTDTTAPTITAAATNENGSEIVLTASEVLDEDAGDNPADFRVTFGGATVNPATVTIAGAKITLAFDSAIAPSQLITLQYRQPSIVTARIRDIAGNDMLAFDSQSVVNNAVAPTPVPPPFTLPVSFDSTRRDGDSYIFAFGATYNAGSSTVRGVLDFLGFDTEWILGISELHARLDPVLENAQCQIQTMDGHLILALGRLAESLTPDPLGEVGYGGYFEELTNIDRADLPASVRLAFAAHTEASSPSAVFRGRKISGVAFAGRKISGVVYGGRKITL